MMTSPSEASSSRPLDLGGNDRFEVGALLGAGGMGAVYEAFDRDRGIRVALKVLLRVEAAELARFKAEFRALADLRHPHWVRLDELFEAGGRWFFTMELVEGRDFLTHVRGQRSDATEATLLAAASPFTTEDAPTVAGPGLSVSSPVSPPPQVAAIAPDEGLLRAALGQLAEGLAALHAIGKVHRDVKPSNVMVTTAGRVVILDFGLVTEARGLGRVSEEYVAGTVAYMAPEQARAEPVGPEADWYAMGAVLYEALTGSTPYLGSPTQILAAKIQAPPRPPSVLQPRVAPDLEALCVELLHPDPARRPPGAEILRRLGVTPAPDVAPAPAPEGAARFVGRERELAALGEAFAATRGGQAASVLVVGASGVGKSALVRRFTERLTGAHPDAIVLAGRCYEGEWVPFKALDGVVDALGAHLAALPEKEVEALVPEHAALLAQTFLVLRRVPAIARAKADRGAAVDPRDRRLLVFGALKALLAALARRAPLAIVIDDLQWADADGLSLLREILRAPGAPAALVALTARARDGVRPEDLLGGGPEDGLRVVALAPLPRAEARALAEQLVGAGADAGALADESGGHPLFLQELALHRLHAGLDVPASFRLDEALWERCTLLDPPAFRLLGMVALSGGLLAQAVAARAAELDPAAFDRHVEALRAASLVRTGGRRGTDGIEPYHDRIREAVAARLAPADRRASHRRLALTLAEGAPDDHEMLAAHWQGAGEGARAAEHAVKAAARAEAALAFDRAARLYTLAIELGADETPLRARLGEALANAGRGAEAAAAFLAAASSPRLGAAEALDLRRRAADQLLRSGHVDEALAAFRVVLKAVGVEAPGSAKGALAAFLLRRAQIRARGLDFRERSAAGIAPEDLTRIDACWAAGAGLGLIDTILGQYFQARGMLFALDAGEPRRVARALAMEGAYAAADGGKAERRTAEVLGRARTLSERLGDPYALALTTMTEGVAATLTGRWRAGHDACERAEAGFRRSTGATWETSTARWFSLWSLVYLGGLGEAARRVPVRLREAEERGDLYAAVSHSTGLPNLVWLAADDPDTARARCREALSRWSQRTFHVEHWWATHADGQADLYRGDPAAAHAAVTAVWSALRSSLLLMVQLTRLEAIHLRARAALALGRARPGERRARAREAEADARRMAAERMPWSDPLAALLRAGVASLGGNLAATEDLLAGAIRGLDAADMGLYAAAARWQRGRILAGEEGRALVAGAEASMRREGIVAPARFAAMLAPGFED